MKAKKIFKKKLNSEILKVESLIVKLTEKNSEKFIDELELLCKKYAIENNFQFKFS